MHKALFYLSAAGMEFSWIYPLAAVLFYQAQVPPYPPLPGALLFLLGGWSLGSLRRLKVRPVWKLALHLAAASAGTLGTLYFYGLGRGAGSFGEWLNQVFAGPYQLLEGAILALLLFWSAIFYLSGVFLLRRPASHQAVCTRLDLGIAVFIPLIIFISALDTPFPGLYRFLWIFFLFSLAAVFLARKQEHLSSRVQFTYSAVGGGMAFLIGFAVLGVAVVSAFFPHLTRGVDTGYSLLRRMTAPLEEGALQGLIWISSRGAGDTPDQESTLTDPANGASPAESGMISEPLINAVSYLLQGLMLLVVLGLVVFALWMLLRRLLAPPSQDDGKPMQKSSLWSLLSWGKCWQILAGALGKIFSRKIPREAGPAVRFYFRLQSWGKSIGIPRPRHATPRQYAYLLGQYLPREQKDLLFLAEAYNQEIYGGSILPRDQVKDLKRAWKRLARPSNRWKAWKRKLSKISGKTLSPSR